MNAFTENSAIVITCHKRIMPYLEQEVKELGFTIDETFITGVVITGNVNDAIKLNLHLRCASQVLYSLKNFPANHADDIYAELLHFPWENILPENGYFSVTSNVNNPTINNSLFANLRVKDAVVDRMRSIGKERPSTGSDLVGTVIHLFWKNDEATIYIDTSGDSLARHGYRKIPGLAPMLEGLAAATIYASQWNKASPFINPMCGSGTLAIEAALMATKRVPGLFRNNYAFMHIKGYKESVYLNEKEIVHNQIIKVEDLKIIASDISEKAIENSKLNAIAAGVENIIDFEVCDFQETKIPENETGVIMINPEYGDRLGDKMELEETYSLIGDFMKNKCKGYYGYVFTGNLELAKKIGLKANRRIEFYTSTIDCRLLEYELYSGTRKIVKE